MKNNSAWLRDLLGYEFRDTRLLESALTHRSAGGANNERLEFLGDAVLNCVVAMLVYDKFERANEGDLSRFRASLVNGESLAAIAQELEIGERMHLGSGELKSGGFRRKSILADGLEAILGAIYLDGGFAAARTVIEKLVGPRMSQLPSATELKDPKTRLQEALQGRGLGVPMYTVESTTGKAHEQVFRVSCVVADLGLSAQAEGASRRGAEQAAAKQVLDAYNELRHTSK